MKTRRELMLEEMGLTPTWRLRAPASAETGGGLQVGNERSDCENDMPGHIAPPVTLHASPLTAVDDRRSAIMRMDWPALKVSVASCTACPLHARRNKTVFGVGAENADWLFVGEGPGADEDAQGEPFVGQAGKLLDSMLAAIGAKRGDNVYIANIVKCRPPGNRNPAPGEALACEPYLHRQIELIKPRLIVALGKVAAVNLLAREASVASMRGKVHEYRGTPLIVTYHPAYLLRSLPDKAKAWVDLCFAVETMRGLQTRKSDANKETAT
ncbi:MAG: uracil-DNA glycosylase [Pseudomonadota bacterium]